MSPYEVQLKKEERLYPECSYTYQIKPLSEWAEVEFAKHFKRKGKGGLQLPVTKDEKKHYLTDEYLSEHPFSGTATLYYDNPNDSKSSRVDLVKDCANLNMARHFIVGFRDTRLHIRLNTPIMKEGKDYEIIVSDKITHDKPNPMTFDDIKAL